jgi:hypothetical protein
LHPTNETIQKEAGKIIQKLGGKNLLIELIDTVLEKAEGIDAED